MRYVRLWTLRLHGCMHWVNTHANVACPACSIWQPCTHRELQCYKLASDLEITFNVVLHKHLVMYHMLHIFNLGKLLIILYIINIPLLPLIHLYHLHNLHVTPLYCLPLPSPRPSFLFLLAQLAVQMAIVLNTLKT